MKYQLPICLIATVAVTACSSSVEREQTNSGYEYTNSTVNEKTLVVPNGLNVPNRSSEYTLPRMTENGQDELLGKDVIVSSPRLVIPLISSSHIDDSSKKAAINFDQVNDKRALPTTIWERVLVAFKENGIGLESFDKVNNVLVTDWVKYSQEVETSWYELSTVEEEHSKKYELSLIVAPHGRTATLESKLVGYKDAKGVLQTANINPIVKRNDEIDFLNAIVAKYDFDIRLAQNQRLEKIRQGFNSRLDFNADGESSMIVEASYNNTWPRLLLVLRKMGFDVLDYDQSSGSVFVNYNGEDDGFWDNLFSSNELPIEEADYRIYVKRMGNETSVTFKNDENENIGTATNSELFTIFAQHMADESLDI